VPISDEKSENNNNVGDEGTTEKKCQQDEAEVAVIDALFAVLRCTYLDICK